MTEISLNELLMPIRGQRLKELFGELSEILFSSFVSNSPELATKKIESFFNTSPNFDGYNIYGIVEIRNLIFEFANNKSYINGLFILAPHTHWLETSPIVYIYDAKEDLYVIGPHLIVDSEVYKPVSFVFYNGTLLPFEWVDSTSDIDINEYLICAKIMNEVSKIIAAKHYPLGIGLNFRFNQSLFQTSDSCVEIPEEREDSPNYGFSNVIRQGTFVEQQTGQSTGQVAWHPNSINLLSLSENEEQLLNYFRELINQTPNETDKLQLIDELDLLLQRNG